MDTTLEERPEDAAMRFATQVLEMERRIAELEEERDIFKRTLDKRDKQVLRMERLIARLRENEEQLISRAWDREDEIAGLETGNKDMWKQILKLEAQRNEARDEAFKLLNHLLSANLMERDYELPWDRESE